MRSDLITTLKVPFDPHNAADREVVERVADIQIGLLSQPIYGTNIEHYAISFAFILWFD